MQDLVDGLNLFVRGGMEDNDDRSDQTDCAAKLPQDSQFFMQEVCTEDGSYQDTQGAQRRHKDGRRKCVSCEIEDLSQAKRYYACPPQGGLHV
jgi:hypothetical protein